MNQHTQQHLSRATALLQSGHLDAAEQVYLEILAADARNTRALYMHGMVHMQRGNLSEGIKQLQASLSIDPRQPDALNNLGHALQILQKPDEALINYDRAIALKPDYVNAYFNRGTALHDLQRYAEAADSLEQAIRLHPGYVDAYVNMGNTLQHLQRKEEALRCYATALTLAPARPDIHYNRGLLYQDMKRNKEALDCFNKAIALAADFTEAHYSRGWILQELKRHAEALHSFDRAIALKKDHAEAYYQRGLALQQLDRHDEALKSYNQAIALNPDYADAHSYRGYCLMEQGMMEDAKQSLENALKIDPEHIHSYACLALLNAFTEEDAHFNRLNELYTKPSLLPKERSALSFAIGKALENKKKYDEAFDAYHEGNLLHYQEHPYSEVENEELLQWTTTFFTPELIKEYAQLPATIPTATDTRTPIFIVGMPRSGTTLIEQILSSHPSLFGAGELTILDRIIQDTPAIPHNPSNWPDSLAQLRNMGKEYLDRAWKLAPDSRYIIDKMPENFRYIGLIHLMLPNAKIIHSMRDPMDSCFSCYATRFAEGNEFSYNLEALGRYYRRYMKMMEHWHSILPPGRILDVHYENNVASPEHEARRLLEYLEMPWDEACLKFFENKRAIKTASLNQVRKPIYSSSVARWKRFEKHLGPLIDAIHSAT